MTDKSLNVYGCGTKKMFKTKSESIELPEEDFDKLLGLVGTEPKEPTEAERKQQEIDVMKRDTNTAEQTQMLLDLGLDKKQIKALRYEDARVKKIIELQNKKKNAR